MGSVLELLQILEKCTGVIPVLVVVRMEKENAAARMTISKLA